MKIDSTAVSLSVRSHNYVGTIRPVTLAFENIGKSFVEVAKDRTYPRDNRILYIVYRLAIDNIHKKWIVILHIT